MAIAVFLGLLVGMQREWTAHKPVGLRSFALIGTIGGVIGLLAADQGAWIVATGLIAVSAAVLSHSFFLARQAKTPGMTTELAAIATFLLGVLATSGYVTEAVVVGGVVTLLLHWKSQLHKWVARIGESEFQAIARFVLVTLVVLPILPNQAFGPYSVLNPWQIWLMVVLIVSLNLAGYVSLKVSTGRNGALLNGILGGLVSSTATTVSFASRSRHGHADSALAAVVILVASALVYLRILIETAAVAWELLPALAGPIAAVLAVFVSAIAILLFWHSPSTADKPTPGNPAELKTALTFGLLYSVVLFISAAVSEEFGETMLYSVAAVSGLTDVDAITLSVGRLFTESRLDADTAWRAIFIASLFNILFKAGIVAVVGGSALRHRLLPALISIAMAGFAVVTLWS